MTIETVQCSWGAWIEGPECEPTCRNDPEDQSQRTLRRYERQRQFEHIPCDGENKKMEECPRLEIPMCRKHGNTDNELNKIWYSQRRVIFQALETI